MLYVSLQVVVNVQLISLTLLVTMSQTAAVCIKKWKMTFYFLIITGSCPPDNPPISCLNIPCDYQHCPNFPGAQCVLDNCGQCQRKFILNGTDVTDQCSKFEIGIKI